MGQGEKPTHPCPGPAQTCKVPKHTQKNKLSSTNYYINLIYSVECELSYGY